jgi:hypothetical protein
MSERSRHRRIVRVPEPQVPTGDSGLASDRAPTNDEPSVPRPRQLVRLLHLARSPSCRRGRRSAIGQTERETRWQRRVRKRRKPREPDRGRPPRRNGRPKPNDRQVSATPLRQRTRVSTRSGQPRVASQNWMRSGARRGPIDAPKPRKKRNPDSETAAIDKPVGG